MSTNSTDIGGPEDAIVNFDVGHDDDDGPAVPPPPSAAEIDDSGKRGRGRPRKLLPGAERLQAAFAGAPAVQVKGKPRGEETDDEREEKKRKKNKISIIERLQKLPGAVGTGMRPTMFDSEDDMDSEIEALNNDLNTKRGDKAVKKLFLMLIPLIELAVDKIATKETFDLSTYRHLKDEVDDNWEMFDEALQHIAILHSSWFAVTPYHEVAASTYALAVSVNAKNQAMRKRGLAPPSPSVPQNSPQSDDDDNDQDDDDDE